MIQIKKKMNIFPDKNKTDIDERAKHFINFFLEIML
jgi:hypothetical protein